LVVVGKILRLFYSTSVFKVYHCVCFFREFLSSYLGDGLTYPVFEWFFTGIA